MLSYSASKKGKLDGYKFVVESDSRNAVNWIKGIAKVASKQPNEEILCKLVKEAK